MSITHMFYYNGVISSILLLKNANYCYVNEHANQHILNIYIEYSLLLYYQQLLVFHHLFVFSHLLGHFLSKNDGGQLVVFCGLSHLCYVYECVWRRSAGVSTAHGYCGGVGLLTYVPLRLWCVPDLPIGDGNHVVSRLYGHLDGCWVCPPSVVIIRTHHHFERCNGMKFACFFMNFGFENKCIYTSNGEW